MGLSLTIPPAEEPVSLGQIKDHVRIHRDVNDFDLYLDDLNVAARSDLEVYLRRQLLPATWKLTLNVVPNCGLPVIWLPRPPLIEVTEIRYLDSDLVWHVLAEDQYSASPEFEPGKLFPSVAAGGLWPVTANQPGAFEVSYRAGYADKSKVPRMIAIGICEMVRQLHDGIEIAKARSAIECLLHPYRCLDDRVAEYA